MSQTWVQRLVEHCRVRGLPEPTFVTVSDRRGGRTAWSTVTVIKPKHSPEAFFPAKFWYSGENAAQSKQDAAQTALRVLTDTPDPRIQPLPASHYAQRTCVPHSPQEVTLSAAHAQNQRHATKDQSESDSSRCSSSSGSQTSAI